MTHLFFRLLILFVLLKFGVLAISACTCVDMPLKNRFREASTIFIGRLADDIPEDDSLIQNNRTGLIVLEVVKGWKGVKKEYIGIDFKKETFSIGTCPFLFGFDKDTEYLVFAYGKGLQINVECSDTLPVSPEYNSYSQRQIRKLNSYWFRTWSRAYPF